jgi:hypothetical protein
MGDHEDAPSSAKQRGEEANNKQQQLQQGGGGVGAASFTDDFICISEFSEIVGPVPLFCIPESGKGSFNIEKFVIRIMAVDYQNKSCDPGAFVDDTQVVITEPTENAFAYVRRPIPSTQSTTPFLVVFLFIILFLKIMFIKSIFVKIKSNQTEFKLINWYHFLVFVIIYLN